MKKALTVLLEDEDIIELMRILMDSHTEGALAFLREHFKGKARAPARGRLKGDDRSARCGCV